MNHPRQPGRSVTTTVHAMRGRPRGGLVATPDPRTEDEQCLRGLADQFLSRMSARAYSPGSVEAHGWALKYFIDWAVSRRLLTPAASTRPLLEEYQLFLHQFRSARTGALLAVNTQLARLGVIRRFFAWLCRENIIPANPAADLDLPRKQARLLPKSLAIAEIDRLLALPDVSSPFGARDRALLELFYATGVRRTEMVRLELGDFDVAQRTLHVRRGKGGKSRLLPVGDRAARWLSHYLAEIRPLLAGHPGERTLFLSGYGSAFSPAYLGNWVARQMKKAGIEKKGSCHLFRHSCATHMLEGGADIRYIQQMLGHARLDTTQIYTEVSIRALTEAHARSHPHGRFPVSGEGPVDSNEAPGSLCSVPEPPFAPVLASTAEIPAATAPSLTEAPDEPTAVAVDRAKLPSGPAVGTFPGMLEACGWPEGTARRVIEYGYRYLDTNLGRWLSRDPIGEKGGLNLYRFSGNNGPNKVDYFGMLTTVVPGKFVKLIGWDQITGQPDMAEVPSYEITVDWEITVSGKCKEGHPGDLEAKLTKFEHSWDPLTDNGAVAILVGYEMNHVSEFSAPIDTGLKCPQLASGKNAISGSCVTVSVNLKWVHEYEAGIMIGLGPFDLGSVWTWKSRKTAAEVSGEFMYCCCCYEKGVQEESLSQKIEVRGEFGWLPLERQTNIISSNSK